MKTINILSVGKLDQPRKDFFTLLKALAWVDFDYTLTIVGSCKTMNEYAVTLLQTPQVTFKTDLTPKQMEEEYKKADLFILPAYNEPANYSILEAMSYGLPVICSDTNGSRCYVHWGCVFKSRNWNDLYRVITCVVSDLKVWGSFSKTCVKEDHNPVDNVKRLVEVLKSVPYRRDYRDW